MSDTKGERGGNFWGGIIPAELDARKIPPSVPLQSAEAAHVEQVAKAELVNVATDAQSLLAHIRALEASFVSAVNGLGDSPALDHAKTAMMAARQWVVTHLTT